MWTPEGFPGADKVPWQLLIRARLVRDVDAFVASTIVRQVTQVASVEVAARVATAAAEAMRSAPVEKLDDSTRGVAFRAVADFIDICPPWPWPWPWPWPGPLPWFEGRTNPLEGIASPYEGIVLEGALELLGQAGSHHLHEQLGGVLKEAGQF